MRELMALDQHLWPLVVALAFSKNLTETSSRKLLESESYKTLTQRPGAEANASLIYEHSRTISLKTLKDAENLLEQSLSEDVKKNDGAVYTPEYIINFILKECLTSLGSPSYTMTTVLDPACGSGGFLIGALRQLTSLTGEPFHSASKRVFGLDRNEEAVQNARLLLDLACLQFSGELSMAKIEVCDTLLTPVEQQLALIGREDGVSILATNPPYVKLQTLPESYRAQLLSKFPLMASGAFSLATLFIGNSTSYLEGQGVAGFITLNNLFTSISGKQLRQGWASNKEVGKIIDFRHFPVFEASAYTCLLFLDRKIRSNLKFAAMNVSPNAETLEMLDFADVPYSGLNSDKWRLATESNLDLVTRLEFRGTKLKDAAEIKVGLATLFDKAFVCSFSEAGYAATGGDGVERKIESGIIEKFTKISELSESRPVSTAQRGIIYPYSKASSSREVLPWSDILSKFPVAAEHLSSWQERLLKRSGVKSETWYEWGRRQSLISDPGKLFTKTFDKTPNFYFDDSDGLFANGYSLRPSKSVSDYSIFQMKAFLESRFMHAYALVTSFEIEGGYQCYQKNFIENICLPPSNLLPTGHGEKILPGSSREKEIAEFYGFTIKDLDSCLAFYLN